MQNTKKSTYLILSLLAGIYLSFIFYYRTMPKYIVFSTIIFGILYIIWGVAHHLREHNFHYRIVLEYLLVAILGVAIVSSLLV